MLEYRKVLSLMSHTRMFLYAQVHDPSNNE